MKAALLALLCLIPFSAQDKPSASAKSTQDKAPEIRYTADSVWAKVNPEGAGAKFSMPNEPKYVKIRMDKVVKSQAITVHQYKTTINKGTANFVFVYNDINYKLDTERKINNYLNSGMQGSKARVLGTMVSTKNIMHGKHPGREFTYDAELGGIKYRFSAKIILVEKRLYQLNLIMVKDQHDPRMVQKFFDSFKLVTAKAASDADASGENEESSEEESDGETPTR